MGEENREDEDLEDGGCGAKGKAKEKHLKLERNEHSSC